MTVIDYAFLVVAFLVLLGMVIGSKVIRAILWEMVRHPFRSSRIHIQDGQVSIVHDSSFGAEKEDRRSPAGAS